jgi:uncharacterized protein (DUF486 family)
MTWLPPAIAPIVLLLISNVFMTFAWYGPLRPPGHFVCGKYANILRNATCPEA